MAAVLGFGVRIAAGKLTSLPQVRSWTRLIFITAAVVGSVLGVLETQYLSEANASREWPTARAVVVTAEVVGERAIRPEVDYRYNVRDVEYTGQSDLHAPMFGGKRKKYDVARESLREYHPGDSITIHYNPKNPAISVLTPGPAWSIYGRLGFALTLVVGGLFGLSLPAKRRP